MIKAHTLYKRMRLIIAAGTQLLNTCGSKRGASLLDYNNYAQVLNFVTFLNLTSVPVHIYGVPFVSKLKKFEGLRFMLVFTTHDASIYDSCWYLRFMLVFTIHAGICDGVPFV